MRSTTWISLQIYCWVQQWNNLKISHHLSKLWTNFEWHVFYGLRCTGWLKLKYPTRQNAISRQPCEIFTPKFLDLYGRDPATILKFLNSYFGFLQSYGYINILCHIFNFGTEKSTATCNCHCHETLTVITNTRISQVVHFSVCSKSPPPAFTQARSLFGSFHTSPKSDFGICNNSQSFLTMKITSFCWLFRAKLKIWHRIFIVRLVALLLLCLTRLG